MAAISSVMLGHVSAGDRVVAMRQCYGGTLDVLRWGSERFGWSVELLDARDPRDWEQALAKRPRLVHVESPTNPTLCVVDIAEVARLAHRHGALLSVDNTVASPLGQSPLALGADFVLYSATKSIGGHSDLLAGVALGAARVIEPVWQVRHHFGGVPDPSVAWLIERSLMTLALRVERMNANASEIARRLADDPRVTRVFHPSLERHPGHEIAKRQMRLGFGPLFAFEVPGGAAGAEAVSEALTVAKNAPSLGSVHTLVSLPVYTSHRKMTTEQRTEAGIPDGLVRVSAGIEDVEDLWADFDRALAKVGAAMVRG
jgi:cystathionine gamma-synthase